jgi:hypothetical protein
MEWNFTAVSLKRYSERKLLLVVRSGELGELSSDNPVVYSIMHLAEKRHVPVF